MTTNTTELERAAATDYAIMLTRMRAQGRGASPVEVQQIVEWFGPSWAAECASSAAKTAKELRVAYEEKRNARDAQAREDWLERDAKWKARLAQLELAKQAAKAAQS